MSIFPYLSFVPKIGQRVFIADGAKIIGRAELHDHVNVWFNTVIRADVNRIIIGKNTNVQDLCMFHVTEQNDVQIGENTSFGHSVTLHGCKIGNGCLIGMGSIILDGAEIGDNCLVAAGSLITPGKKFPSGSFIKGRPATLDRPLSIQEIEQVSNHYKSYLGYKEEYLKMNGEHEKKNYINGFKKFFVTVDKHNLFLLASSISYYAALALAPMILILLGVAALVGPDVQLKVLEQMSLLAPELSETFQLVLKNLNEEVDFGSVSGIIGAGTMILLSSYLFLQLRYSFDLIDGYLEENSNKTFWQIIKERAFFMIVVLLMCVLFMFSLMIGPAIEYIFSIKELPNFLKSFTKYVSVFCIFIMLFTGLYYFTPSRKRKILDCFKMSLLTSTLFILGNYLIGLYMKTIAVDSLYGAAGALLVFLLWTYYSSVTIFLGVEIFEFFKKKKTPLLMRSL